MINWVIEYGVFIACQEERRQQMVEEYNDFLMKEYREKPYFGYEQAQKAPQHKESGQ